MYSLDFSASISNRQSNTDSEGNAPAIAHSYRNINSYSDSYTKSSPRLRHAYPDSMRLLLLQLLQRLFSQFRWPNISAQRRSTMVCRHGFCRWFDFSDYSFNYRNIGPNVVSNGTLAPTLTYNIPVVNDTYTVTLYFAEIYFDAPGQRVFNVRIEGHTVLQNFDIWAVAGQFAVVKRTFVVTVTDGVLTLSHRQVSTAKFSAIQVVTGSCCADSNSNSKSYIYGLQLAGDPNAYPTSTHVRLQCQHQQLPLRQLRQRQPRQQPQLRLLQL